MSSSISTKTDYSALFNSMNRSINANNSISSLTSLLTDYSNIKTGSYGKLMKAYYNAADSKESKTDSTKKEDTKSAISTVSNNAKALGDLESKADALKTDADKLYVGGKESVFASDDMEKILSTVKSFVSNYNSTMEASEGITDNTVSNRMSNLKSITANYSKVLSNIGISVKQDNTLSLDQEVFKKNSVDKLKSVFNGAGSYGYAISAQASLIGYAANSAANTANSYTATGNYYKSVDVGSIFNSMF